MLAVVQEALNYEFSFSTSLLSDWLSKSPQGHFLMIHDIFSLQGNREISLTGMPLRPTQPGVLQLM